MARGTQPEPPTKLIGADKAQNDVRLASNVGHRVTPGIVRCHFSFDSYRGSSSPLIEIGYGGSRRSLKERGLIFRWLAHSESSICYGVGLFVIPSLLLICL